MGHTTSTMRHTSSMLGKARHMPGCEAAPGAAMTPFASSSCSTSGLQRKDV